MIGGSAAERMRGRGHGRRGERIESFERREHMRPQRRDALLEALAVGRRLPGCKRELRAQRRRVRLGFARHPFAVPALELDLAQREQCTARASQAPGLDIDRHQRVTERA